ncbi:MAG: glycosyltransferase family 4 protein [Lachnospiraceae bacterium]
MKQIYAKCSTQRSPEFAIITNIYKTDEGFRIVKKPYMDASAHHVSRMLSVYEQAKEVYQDSKFSYADVKPFENGIEMEYLKGKNFEDIADWYLLNNQPMGAIAILDEVIAWMRQYSHEVFVNEMPENFVKVFGNHFSKNQYVASDIGNIDLILPNIIDCNDTYKVIDYEWSFDLDIPVDYIIYRMLFSYLESNQMRASLKKYGLYEKYGISKEDILVYQDMEDCFQSYVRGNVKTMGDFSDLEVSEETIIDPVFQEEKQESYDISFYEKIQDIRCGQQQGDYYFNIIQAMQLYHFCSPRLKNAYGLDNESNVYDVKIYFSEKQTKYQKTVTLVSHELNRTGAPVVLQDMAKVLLEQKNNVFIVSPVDGPLREEYVKMGCTVIIQHNLMTGLYTNEVVPEEKMVLLNDLVRKSSFTVFCTLVLYNLVSHYIDTDYPIYWWLHEGDITFESCKDYLPKRISNNIRVLAGGQYVLDRFKKYGLPEYNGRILSYLVEDVSCYEPKKHDNPVVKFVCVGTIDYRKGQDLLVEAIKLLPYKYLTQIDVTFIGAGNYDYIVKKILALTKHYPNVHLLGTMSRAELYEEYEKADCIISPSRDDPMPVVLTENMRIGNICMCSTATGTSTYIENGMNGFVFESENIEEIAKQIMYVVDHKNQLFFIGENSRKIYEENFSRNVFEKNIKKLLA